MAIDTYTRTKIWITVFHGQATLSESELLLPFYLAKINVCSDIRACHA